MNSLIQVIRTMLENQKYVRYAKHIQEPKPAPRLPFATIQLHLYSLYSHEEIENAVVEMKRGGEVEITEHGDVVWLVEGVAGPRC